MDIKVNPSLYNNVFVVPTSVVDDNIRLAGSASLKTLLWFIRNMQNSPTPEQASKALGLSLDDVKDAISYWVERGVLVTDDTVSTQEIKISTEKPAITINIPQQTDTQDEKLLIKPTKKPTMAEVVKRGNESPEIKFLLNEAQKTLGRTLTNNDAETLLWLADYCEMPVSVILMAINFAASRNNSEKNTLRMRYIEKIVLSWMEEEIFTVDEAEEKIKEITKREGRWYKLQSLFGLEKRTATAKEEELCNFVDSYDLPDDLVKSAYDETINKKGKYSAAYLLGILKKWREKGIKSVDDVATEKSAKPISKKATFDIEEYEKLAIKGPQLKKNK